MAIFPLVKTFENPERVAIFRKKYSDRVILFLQGNLEPGEQISECLRLTGLSPKVFVICFVIGAFVKNTIEVMLKYQGLYLKEGLGSYIFWTIIPIIIAYFLGYFRDSSLAVSNKNIYLLSQNFLDKPTKIIAKSGISSFKLVIKKDNLLSKWCSQIGLGLTINGKKYNYSIFKQWKDVLEKIMFLLAQSSTISQTPPIVLPQTQPTTCSKCGNLLTANQTFCNQCGNKVS